MEKNIICERHGNIEILTINRPDKGNSLPREDFINLDAYLKELASDRGLKALIITAFGTKHFCTGIDISRVAGASSERAYWEQSALQNAISSIEDFHRPVIAAINGTCVGIGLELCLACDIRLASITSKFSLPEVSLGIPPDSGGTQRLTRLVGPGQAKRLILSGMDN